MAVKAYNTITLISIDDINISMTEPESPVVDQLWLDTSKEPNELMRYDGTGWVRTQHNSLEEFEGGHNILKNPRFGGTELPDAGHWYSGGTVAGYVDWYGYLTVDEFLSLYGSMTVNGFLTTSLMGGMG